MKVKTVKPFDVTDDGEIEFNLAADAANDDWIRAARLLDKAKKGDKKAAEILKKLEETPVVEIIE